MSRNAYVEYAKPQVIGETAGWRETYKARYKNKEFDKEIERRRKQWKLKPPSNMHIVLRKDLGALPGGVILSVSHEVGRMLLHKRLCNIIERDDVTVDAVIEGSLETAVEAMGRCAA